MKKRIGKLALSKETLHSLDPNPLAAVAAGATRFCTAMICPQSAVGGTCEGTCNPSCIEA